MPIVVFVTGCAVLFCILYNTHSSRQQQVRTVTELNATTYADRMTSEFNAAISITTTLEEIIVNNGGYIENFSKVASDLMKDYIQSVQLAPGGVVTDIYPAAGNEAGKIDLFADESRSQISRYARDHKVTVVQGPFELKQGGRGIAIRNPVYIESGNGEPEFWGFTIAIIRVPEIFTDSVQALKGFGYEYCLSKTKSPLSSEYEEISSSGAVLENPVSYEFELCCCKFKLEVMPSDGWNRGSYSKLILIVGLIIIVLLTGLTSAMLILDKHRETFKILSTRDSLTGLLNRNGFLKQAERFVRNNPEDSCVGIQLDIDDFKFINDVYGHAAGDAALQQLADDMRECFPKGAILGRNGGDEFSILLTGVTCNESHDMIEAFTDMEHCFKYETAMHSFHISLGYAEYPADADDLDALNRNADKALYEAKLQGKNNCVCYHSQLNPQKRSHLGFALQDISQNLPGAFLIYKADAKDDRILFANRELIEFAGCRDLDEFLEYSAHSFRNLICPDEQEAVEASIWRQINSANGSSDDYVQFHFVRKDGSYRQVLDHGRIVESTYYGRIFYVLIMDCSLLQAHYE